MDLTEREKQRVLWAFDVAVGEGAEIHGLVPDVARARLELALALADGRVRDVVLETSADGKHKFTVVAEPEPS